MGIDQNTLPQQYRLGACNEDGDGGAAMMKPFSMLTVFAVMVLTLANII